ncbi:MAG: ABC transporter permease [Ignavibacteriales bacterium]|nr:MAG: ABC transporter permease [Ignavibacteriales bacterium]
MFNYRLIAIIRRELREKLFSKSFILMTLLIPVFMFGIIGIQALLMAVGSEEKSSVQIIAGNEEIYNRIEKEISQLEFVKSGFYSVEYHQFDKTGLTNHIKNIKTKLLDNKITGIIFIPESALKDKKLEYYSSNPNNTNLFNKLRNPINKALVGIYFDKKSLTPDEVSFASEGVDFNGFRVSKDEKIEEEGYGNLVLSFLFTFLLYMSLLFTGTIMMRSVLQEKTSRVVEVLLSSVNSKELIAGKIIGTSVTAVAQMFIWLIPIIVLISTTWFVLPPEVMLKIKMWHIGYFLFNYLVGVVTFLGLFAAAGSIFDNDQDAQAAVWPIMMLIMIPFFIAMTMTTNPDTGLIRISSLVPFASLMIMPSRLTLIEVSWFELSLATVINIATMFCMFWLGGKIYRIGILMTGKKPKWSEVVKWLKLKN